MKNEESIIRDVVGLYSEGLESEETSTAILNEINRFDKEKSWADPAQLYTAVRREFLKLSIMTKKCKTGNIHHQAVSDILYFYAFTFRYFTCFEYPMVRSDPVAVRRCDLPDHSRYLKDEHNSAAFEGKDLESSRKTYSSSFIWGQMCLWWKQTVILQSYPQFTELTGILGRKARSLTISGSSWHALLPLFQRQLQTQDS